MRYFLKIASFLIVLAPNVFAAWSEPRPVPGINTLSTEYYPSLTADGSKMYFASTRSGNEDIYVSTRVNGQWTIPVNLGSPINSLERDLCPSISADGRTLYFVTYNRTGGLGSYDIWYSTWNDSTQSWNNPINPGPNINSPGMEWSPCLTHDGTKLYYALGDPLRPGWLGGLDLYVSEIGPDGWLPSVTLGNNINTYSDDYCPSIAPDDTTLYFASWHHHNLPCWHGPAVDLFVAYYSGGQWDNVSNLCIPINTEYWERSPYMDASGDTLYFARAWPALDSADNILYSVREPDAVEEPVVSPPREFFLSAYPNPFNSITTISVNSMEDTQIGIYDITGRRVASLQAEHGKAIWDANAFSSGLYFARAEAKNNTQSIKLILLK
jgi:hypothetical protein